MLSRSDWNTTWTFDTKHLTVMLEAAPEDMAPEDSFTEQADIDAVRNGEVEWFVARVSVWVKHPTHTAMIASDLLGGCAYKSLDEFRRSHITYKGSDYFTDMVRGACHQARKYLSDLHTVRLRSTLA